MKTKVYHQRKIGKKYYYVDSEDLEKFDDAAFIIDSAKVQRNIGKQKIKKYKFKINENEKFD